MVDSINILLADDHEIMRRGLRALLEQNDRLKVIGEASTGKEAFEMTRGLEPDLVIMDVGLPEVNGIEATRKILSLRPTCRILALSMHADRRFVTQMLEAGAKGYLLKDCAVEELDIAIRAVLKNQVYLSPAIASYFVNRSATGEGDQEYATALSPREREVLQLISEGNPTAQIAAKLHVSIKTIESHRKNIMDKLDLHSVAELTKYAIRSGLTSI
ncbi:MAG: response regulator transcription factor [Gammaproteobacteria bacterium]|nr:response regulator transcription factor [Gammaproteobacteria bacterium]